MVVVVVVPLKHFAVTVALSNAIPTAAVPEKELIDGVELALEPPPPPPHPLKIVINTQAHRSIAKLRVGQLFLKFFTEMSKANIASRSLVEKINDQQRIKISNLNRPSSPKL